MRNGPNTLDTLKLPLESQVRVWCEKKGWKGPYMLLSIKGETCVFDMPRGPRKFCSTVVKPYLRKENDSFQDLSKDNENDSNTSDTTTTLRTASKEDSPIVMPQPNVTTRGRNRFRISKNFHDACHIESYSCSFSGDAFEFEVFVTSKEKLDRELALKLRNEGLITNEGVQFQLADLTEIEGLLAGGVFEFEKFDIAKHGDLHIFKSRMVRKVKGKETSVPYEKSRLVIQGHNDEGKTTILTKSPTIQRVS